MSQTIVFYSRRSAIKEAGLEGAYFPEERDAVVRFERGEVNTLFVPIIFCTGWTVRVADPDSVSVTFLGMGPEEFPQHRRQAMGRVRQAGGGQ